MLHEALTGAPVYGEDDDAEYPCLARRPPPLRHVRPRRMAAAIDAALAADAGARPALGELLAVLDDAAGSPAGVGRWAARRVAPAHRAGSAAGNGLH